MTACSAIVSNSRRLPGPIERLRVAVEALRIDNPDSPAKVVTVSVGAASASLTGQVTAAGLIVAANKSLYEAKGSGRNQFGGLTAALA